MATDFSRTLSLLRQEKGVSQRKAAGELGISQALLSHYENGIREPGLAFVVKACAYYHVSADFLLGRTLNRDGSIIEAEDVYDSSGEKGSLRGSILATLQKKLVVNTTGVLFELLGKTGDREAITAHASELAELAVEEDEILRSCGPLTAEDRVFLARHPERPHIDETISALFTDFFEQRGDRQCKEDAAILGGVARFHGMPVTVIGHRKGSTLEENLACNFGMPGPEGYRKALRLMKQAEKFGRPIITFIDTPGAYPGKDAEERGQGEAIARNLMEMSGLTVPVIAVVTGEGSSGGALALGVANHILMLENAVYSVLSPEGFASILWKDSSRSGEACEMMKLTAQDLYRGGIVEEVIPEPVGGAQRCHAALFERIDAALRAHLKELCRMSDRQLADQRYKKYRQIGETRNA